MTILRFLGLGLEERIPDAKTIWLFREHLTCKNLITELFDKFDMYLRENGYQAKGGQLIDAILIPIPKQRENSFNKLSWKPPIFVGDFRAWTGSKSK